MKTGDTYLDLNKTRPRGESSTLKAKTSFVPGALSENLKEMSAKRRSSANPSKIPFFRLNSENSKKSKLRIHLDLELFETFEEDSSPQSNL
jgi:hypothetical protein